MDHPHSPDDGFFAKPGPVPVVDAADLRAMWNVQNDLQARLPGGKFSVDRRIYEHVLRPGADANAVWYRLSIFHLLQRMSSIGTFSLPSSIEGNPSDAVFKALAVVPMQKLPVGIPTDALPVDLNEFSRMIEEEAGPGASGS